MITRRYETLILIDPEQGDAGAKELGGRIRALVEGQGATVSQLQEWGLRDLAYSIAKHRRAYHFLLEYRATPAALAEIGRNLRLMEPVLRHTSVRQEEGAPPAVARPAVTPEPAPAPARGREGGDGEGAQEEMESTETRETQEGEGA